MSWLEPWHSALCCPPACSHTYPTDSIGAVLQNNLHKALPDGTLGKGYYNFMDGHKFSPDSRSAVQFVDDPELAYVMRR